MKLRKISLGRPTEQLLFEIMEVDEGSKRLTLKSISLPSRIQTVRSPLRSMHRPSDFDYKYRIDEEGNLL